MSLALTGMALIMLGYGLFDVGSNDPSNAFVYSLVAPVVLNWLAFFGSKS